VTIEAVEARMKALADKGQLIFGTSGRPDRNVTHVTTPEHIAEERRLLEGIDAGRGLLVRCWLRAMPPRGCRRIPVIAR
jgi:hypothetical protein